MNLSLKVHLKLRLTYICASKKSAYKAAGATSKEWIRLVPLSAHEIRSCEGIDL